MSSERDNIDNAINQYLEQSLQLVGSEVKGREGWNEKVTPESIKHFAFGIGDDRALWVDPVYAADGPYQRLVAPPSYLASVMYPVTHGAAIPVPLTDLIGELEYEWYQQIRVGDTIRSKIFVRDVTEYPDRGGRRTITISSEVRYWNQRGQLLATARSMMARPYREDNELLMDRLPERYSDADLARIDKLHREERDRRGWLTSDAAPELDGELPEVVRGPLTIGDMVCWQAGAGPSYRAGVLGYLDTFAAPHTASVNPVTGWPVKKSMQHEDFRMAAERGMPAPFDNGVMRFAIVSTVVTNLLPDTARLVRLKVEVLRPNVYGDCTFFRTRVMDKAESDTGLTVTLKLEGINQVGDMSTTAVAEIHYPASRVHLTPFLPDVTVDVPDPLEMFSDAVREQEGRAALIERGQVLSYRELDTRCNRLAHALMMHGVTPGDFIGIHLERGMDNVCMILAVMKAGAVYVPMDPAFSNERVDEVIEYLPFRGVVARKAHEKIFDGSRAQAFYMEDLETAQVDMLGTAPKVGLPKDALAYVMHTSGSVGRPKSAAVRRSALASYIQNCRCMYPEGAETFLHTATSSFSASTRQTFYPLLNGHTLIVASEDERGHPGHLLQLIREKNIHVIDSVPSVFRLLTQSLNTREAEALPLKGVFLTGQALPWELARTWHQDCGQTALVTNLYSQTETSGTISYFTVDPKDLQPEGVVPVGRALADSPIFLMDEQGKEVPFGEKGEVWVGGNRLSEGYLNLPEQAMRRFISNEQGALFYRTGDWGVRNATGDIEYAGRLDDKIKVRGIGVELGDVEREIEKHAVVSQAAVVARENSEMDMELHAFVVLEDESDADENTLRAELRDTLPSHFVPASLTGLEAMPLGSTGKIQRSALPLPERRERQEVPALSGTPLERLCTLWAHLLSLRTVAADDNFFDLGGHSIKAAELCVQVKAEFDFDLDVSDIVSHPTPGQLMAYITGTPTEEGAGPTHAEFMVQLKRGEKPDLFCVPGVGGHLMRHQDLPKYVGEEQSFWGIQASHLAPFAQVENLNIEGVAAPFVEQLKTVQASGPYHLLGTCFGGVLAFEMAMQLQQAGEEVATLILVETRATQRMLPAYVPLLEKAERIFGFLSAKVVRQPVKAPMTVQQKQDADDAQSRKVNAPNFDFKIRLRQARKGYQPGSFKGNLVLLKVLESPYRRHVTDHRRFWKNVTDGRFVSGWIPGSHLTMLEEPRVQVLGKAIQDILAGCFEPFDQKAARHWDQNS